METKTAMTRLFLALVRSRSGSWVKDDSYISRLDLVSSPNARLSVGEIRHHRQRRRLTLIPLCIGIAIGLTSCSSTPKPDDPIPKPPIPPPPTEVTISGVVFAKFTGGKESKKCEVTVQASRPDGNVFHEIGKSGLTVTVAPSRYTVTVPLDTITRIKVRLGETTDVSVFEVDKPITYTVEIKCGDSIGAPNTKRDSLKSELVTGPDFGEREKRVEIDPPPSPDTVGGTVLNSNNQAIRNGSVGLLSNPTISTKTDSFGIFTLAGVPPGSSQILVASAAGFLTTLVPIKTCTIEDVATGINLASLTERDILIALAGIVGLVPDPALGIIGGTVRKSNGAGIPNAVVRITPSSGKERILFFDPRTLSLADKTKVFPGHRLDASFLILNVNPALGPYTVAAFDAKSGRFIDRVENVVVQRSNVLTANGVVTQVDFGIRKCSVKADVASVSGSASRVGVVPPPERDAGAQVGILEKFTFAGRIDLAASTVIIDSLLNEAGGAGELLLGLPILIARRGGKPNAAIFETPSRAIPKFRLEIQTKGQGLYDWLLRVDKGTIPKFPQMCSGERPPKTNLTTSFIIDDGINPPVQVSTTQPWRCLDLIGGDPEKPRSLRVP